MALPITYEGVTYDLSNPTQFQAYQTRINRGKTPTQAPAETTQNLVNTYNQGGNQPLTTQQIGSAIQATQQATPVTTPVTNPISTPQPPKAPDLTGLAEAFDFATNLGKANRNKVLYGLAQPYTSSGVAPLSDFTSIVNNLNRASMGIGQNLYDATIDQYKNEFDFAKEQYKTKIDQLENNKNNVRNLALELAKDGAGQDIISSITAFSDTGDIDSALKVYSSYMQNNSKNNFKLEQVGSSVYQIETDPKTGQVISQKPIITGSGSGLTATERGQVQDNLASVNVYKSTMQQAIDEGASPAEAVMAAVAVASSVGTTLGLQEQNALLNEAQNYFNSKNTTSVPNNQSQFINQYNPVTGQTTQIPINQQPQGGAWQAIGNIINPLSKFLFGE